MSLALHLLGNREDAEDIRQEVCIRCILGQNRLRDQAARQRWLYRMLMNVCKDFLRRKKRRPELAEAEVEAKVLEAAQEIAVVEQANIGEQQAAIHDLVVAALALLPEKQRQLLTWRYMEEQSYTQIARRAGMKRTTIDVSLRRSRRAFHETYERLLNQEEE